VQAGLCRPELLVEIELIAVVPQGRAPQEAQGNGSPRKP
jgi:hypothetical protein